VGRYRAVEIEYVARLEMIQVVVLAALFLLVLNNLYRQESVLLVCFTLVVVGTGIASYAIFQWLTHSSLVWHEVSPYPGRASGTYISPNHLAGLLEMVLPLALAFLLAGRMPVLVRILLGYGVGVMLLGLCVTFSRGGWAGAGLGFLAVFGLLATHRKHRWRALGLLLVMGLGVVLFGSHYLAKSRGFKSHIVSVESAKSLDLDIRLQLWRSAERMWLDHFWWGVGPGLFDYRFREYRPEEVQLRPDRVHNDYLNLLTDWGVVGGGLVLVGLGLFVVSLARTWGHVRRSENEFGSGQSNRFAFFVGATGGLVALAAHSAVDFNLHIPANAVVGVVLLGLLMSNVRFATEKYWVNFRWWWRVAAALVLVAGVGYLARQGWQRVGEARWLQVAEGDANPFAAEYVAALESAYAVDDQNFDTTYSLGEAYRLRSFQGGDDYEAEATTALRWYARGMKLDPYDGYNHLRSGMCLDWLEKQDAAEAEFRKAEALDPNGYYMVANIGWHFVQVGDDAAARQYFLRSLGLQTLGNDIAQNYLRLTEARLIDKASGTNNLPAGF
jgi:O-antigen ligase